MSINPHLLTALDRMSTEELYSIEDRIREAQLGFANEALLEALKAGAWLQWGAVGSGAVIGLNVSRFIPVPLMIAISVGIVIATLIGFGGAHWHRQRGRARLEEGRAFDAMRTALGQEMDRRGLG